MLRTVAVARLLLGGRVNIQAPPNLSADHYPALLHAGLNDWGGISPLTVDHINPEAPWPLIGALRRATEAAGFELRERLAIYPEYASRPEFLAEGLRPRVQALVDGHGYVRTEYERWRQW
jgi:FO synthase